MGTTGRTFLHIRMEEDYYNKMDMEHKEVMEIRRVEIEGEEYPTDPIWLDLNKISKKAYKDLKNYEYDKRHKKVKQQLNK